MTQALDIVILAAGEGTRMRSALPKVLQPLAGRPMLAHLLDTVRDLEPDGVHVVYGSGGERVPAAFADYPGINWVFQENRLGTGHALTQAMPGIADSARVLVLLGDHPLVPGDLLRGFVETAQSALGMLSMQPDDPTGYGRVVRDRVGRVRKIVEEKDATAAQKSIGEVNTGIIVADAGHLRGWLAGLAADNAQGEYYLTDIFALAHAEGVEIEAVTAPDAADLQGANDRAQLAALERICQARAARELMLQGAALADPARVEIRGPVTVGSDVFIDVNCVLEGGNSLADGCRVGCGCVLRDCELAAGTVVKPYSVLEGVRTGRNCEIGPYARLRPGTELRDNVRIGNFVETKAVTIDRGSKANHLSYLGDAAIGEDVNIGAGTITCNYDGANKHRTVIEDDVFIGSDSQLVAPVTIGRGATVGAGSTITRDVPPGDLAVSRTRQHTVRNWRRPRKKERG